MPNVQSKNKETPTKNARSQTAINQSTKLKKNTFSAEELALKDYNENVKRLAESAVRRRTIKTNTSKNSPSYNKNIFSNREELLKYTTLESERFQDTTYYIIRMEGDSTELITNIIAGTGEPRNIEYFEKLIRSFDADVIKYEKTEVFDCANFLMYSNQFEFNDSLQQKALYHYGDCCFFNDNLDEAAIVF